jgi:dirigent-like protein
MIRRLLPLGAASILAVLVIGCVSAASGTDGGAQPHEFIAIDTTVKETDIDVDHSKSSSIGDQFIEHDVLKNETQTKTIGALDAICTFTDVSEDASVVHCVATVTLHGGTLEVAGLLNFADEQGHVAITGGTGSYDEARGQLTLQAINNTDVRITLEVD